MLNHIFRASLGERKKVQFPHQQNSLLHPPSLPRSLHYPDSTSFDSRGSYLEVSLLISPSEGPCCSGLCAAFYGRHYRGGAMLEELLSRVPRPQPAASSSELRPRSHTPRLTYLAILICIGPPEFPGSFFSFPWSAENPHRSRSLIADKDPSRQESLNLNTCPSFVPDNLSTRPKATPRNKIYVYCRQDDGYRPRPPPARRQNRLARPARHCVPAPAQPPSDFHHLHDRPQDKLRRGHQQASRCWPQRCADELLPRQL